MEPKPARSEPLVGKLQRIEDLAEKLVYIKWSREFFVLLQRATQDILSLARPRPELQKIVALAERLDRQVAESLESGELPKGAQRERLIAVMDALCRSLPPQEDGAAPAPGGGAQRPSEPLTTPLFSKWDKGERSPPATAQPSAAEEATVWLVAPDSLRELAKKLEQRGSFKIQLCAGLPEVRKLLAESRQPVALIIDLDHSTDNQAILQQIATLRQMLTPDVPLLFLADRGDISARLDAVEAGGAGYFIKPVDIPLLVETLDERVLSSQNQRVLIVDDTLPSAREIARWLDSRGMVTQVLAQPLQILQALRNFRPNLLIMSLDQKETDGLMLAQAVLQHLACLVGSALLDIHVTQVTVRRPVARLLRNRRSQFPLGLSVVSEHEEYQSRLGQQLRAQDEVARRVVEYIVDVTDRTLPQKLTLRLAEPGIVAPLQLCQSPAVMVKIRIPLPADSVDQLLSFRRGAIDRFLWAVGVVRLRVTAPGRQEGPFFRCDFAGGAKSLQALVGGACLGQAGGLVDGDESVELRVVTRDSFEVLASQLDA